MSDFVIEHCGSCSAPVIWAITTQAKKMPVDAEPTSDGNVALEARPVGLPVARVLSTAKQFGRTGLRKSHFATCKFAAQHRRRRV